MDLALLLKIDAELIEEQAEPRRVDRPPLRREVSTVGASAPLSISALQLSIGPSGLSELSDPGLNLFHTAAYYNREVDPKRTRETDCG